ncbi:hypothetical protein UA08_04245 [Talaromyces atroroseus]|uniref:Metallo-beta-lactamase domain-containing protein n=1 Tax=Talaromyces atroroseus TaxID=1441469 RepID=A0A1Q5Q9D5_TALAT|nr:hypothetical protein UA08_04245 [Talaromyces atroroseus]OKL60746.1 hypothetical protein UA08_04245 [Talaromyces atroroseus]
MFLRTSHTRIGRSLSASASRCLSGSNLQPKTRAFSRMLSKAKSHPKLLPCRGQTPTSLFSTQRTLHEDHSQHLCSIESTKSGEPTIHAIFEKVTGTWQYLIADPVSLSAVIIDAVLDFDRTTQTVSTQTADSLLGMIKKYNYRICMVLETHVHADHLTASSYLQSKLAQDQGAKPPIGIGKRISQIQTLFGQRYMVPEAEYKSAFGKLFDDDEEFKIGELTATAIHLPGHTPDHLGYRVGENVFCGDSIFHVDIGTARCDFPGGSAHDLFQSGMKLLSLPEQVRIWMGHDYPSPDREKPKAWMSVQEHREHNKHLKNGMTLNDYISLREKRDAQMQEPKLLHQSLQVNIRAGRLPEPAISGHRMLHLPLRFQGVHWDGAEFVKRNRRIQAMTSSRIRIQNAGTRACRLLNSSKKRSRGFSTSPISSNSWDHKVVVIGGGSAGLAISHQLLRSGKFAQNDIAVVDPATWHHFQPGWTLVGGGLKTKEQLSKPLANMIDPNIKFYNEGVATFMPNDNQITLQDGDKLSYQQLVVAPGIKIDYNSIQGLPEALANPDSQVSSIYGYETCDKVYRSIQQLKSGTSIFTQPAGIIKCAGAPQKIMWLAWDYWKKRNLYQASGNSQIKMIFATGLPTMFGVPKYNAKLEELRQERGIQGCFQHDLLAIDQNTATFALPDGKGQVKKHFDFLHVVPKMGAHDFIKNSALANEAGYVDVNPATTQHKTYANIWSAGDASSMPTSKTAAAITSQAPVLVNNLLHAMDGNDSRSTYDGYTSCPLLTEYGKVLLAEFKYGGEPKETFSWLGIDQVTPRRAFYHLKKDFFPWVYYKHMVKGTWAGPKGWLS